MSTAAEGTTMSVLDPLLLLFDMFASADPNSRITESGFITITNVEMLPERSSLRVFPKEQSPEHLNPGTDPDLVG
jgi:hypothetical protein